MSNNIRIAYLEANRVCNEILSTITPYCEDVRVAGSVRRYSDTVGDIELVIIPQFLEHPQIEQLSLLNTDVHVEVPSRNLSFEALAEMCKLYDGNWFRLAQENKKDGEKYKKFEVVTTNDQWIQVDIFFADKENFGLIYLLRSGPASFSKHMITRRKDGGALPNEYRSKGGYLRGPDGEIIPITDERQLFELAGYQYLAAQGRDGWRKLLRPLAAQSDSWEVI